MRRGAPVFQDDADGIFRSRIGLSLERQDRVERREETSGAFASARDGIQLRANTLASVHHDILRPSPSVISIKRFQT